MEDFIPIAKRMSIVELAKNKQAVVKEKIFCGKLYPHQEFCGRIFENVDTIFLANKTGTGKTGKYIAAAKHYRDSNMIRKNFIITREKIHFEITKGIVSNYEDYNIEDFRRTGTRGKPIDDNIIFKRRDIVEKFYVLKTYKKFIEMVASMTDEQIYEEFNFTIITIDELQNAVNDYKYSPDVMNDIRPIGSEDFIGINDLYGALLKVITMAKGVKVIVSTATPMVNDAEDIHSIASVLLRRDTRASSPAELCDEIISKIPIFYTEDKLPVRPKYKGVKYLDFDIPVIPLAMGVYQAQNYKNQDFLEKTFYISQRQASLCNQDFGANNILEISPEHRMAELERNSSTFAHMLKLIESSEKIPGTITIYFDEIKTMGAIKFFEILKLFGYTAFDPRNIVSTRKVVALLTSGVADETSRETINSPLNWDGSRVRIILYTAAFSDGINLYHSFMNLSPVRCWHVTGETQSDARSIRATSHSVIISKLKTDRALRDIMADYFIEENDNIIMTPHIYKYIVYIREEDGEESQAIDKVMYEISRKKQENIDIIMNKLHSASIDLIFSASYTDDPSEGHPIKYMERCAKNTMDIMDTLRSAQWSVNDLEYETFKEIFSTRKWIRNNHLEMFVPIKQYGDILDTTDRENWDLPIPIPLNISGSTAENNELFLAKNPKLHYSIGPKTNEVILECLNILGNSVFGGGDIRQIPDNILILAAMYHNFWTFGYDANGDNFILYNYDALAYSTKQNSQIVNMGALHMGKMRILWFKSVGGGNLENINNYSSVELTKKPSGKKAGQNTIINNTDTDLSRVLESIKNSGRAYLQYNADGRLYIVRNEDPRLPPFIFLELIVDSSSALEESLFPFYSGALNLTSDTPSRGQFKLLGSIPLDIVSSIMRDCRIYYAIDYVRDKHAAINIIDSKKNERLQYAFAKSKGSSKASSTSTKQ